MHWETYMIGIYKNSLLMLLMYYHVILYFRSYFSPLSLIQYQIFDPETLKKEKKKKVKM